MKRIVGIVEKVGVFIVIGVGGGKMFDMVKVVLDEINGYMVIVLMVVLMDVLISGLFVVYLE